MTTLDYATNTRAGSKGMLWTGRVLSTLVVLAMLMASSFSLLKTKEAVEGTVKAGYPESVIRPIGIAAVVSTILYAIPQTSVVGAILLTAYFGGAVATHVRLSEPQFVVAVIFGIVTWLGLFFRDARIRALIPFKTP